MTIRIIFNLEPLLSAAFLVMVYWAVSARHTIHIDAEVMHYGPMSVWVQMLVMLVAVCIVSVRGTVEREWDSSPCSSDGLER